MQLLCLIFILQSLDICNRCHTTSKGSLSDFETWMSTWFWKILVSDSCSTLRNPLSVLLWSHKMTDTPDWAACRMSWWLISPVTYKETFRFFNSPPPDPAQTATDEMLSQPIPDIVGKQNIHFFKINPDIITKES